MIRSIIIRMEIADYMNRMAASIVMMCLETRGAKLSSQCEIDDNNIPIHESTNGDIIVVKGDTPDINETDSLEMNMSFLLNGNGISVLIWDTSDSPIIRAEETMMNHTNIEVSSSFSSSPVDIAKLVAKTVDTDEVHACVELLEIMGKIITTL